MSSLNLGMMIEGLVAVLLLITIGYCMMLNRRLQRLRADEATLRATISELMTATEIAERAILGLKTTATDADQSLSQHLAAAERMSAALAEKVNEGEQVFSHISQVAESARSATANRAPAYTPSYREPVRQPAPAPSYAQQQPNGYQPQYQEPMREPHHGGGYAPAHPSDYDHNRRSGRANDIRSAAAEATERLGRFRQRGEGAVA
ncbi:MAG: chemotaxis protein [Rhodobacteraceae bacterium]|nr:chemotaxis protein [Paracoccaceae bacterium]